MTTDLSTTDIDKEQELVSNIKKLFHADASMPDIILTVFDILPEGKFATSFFVFNFLIKAGINIEKKDVMALLNELKTRGRYIGLRRTKKPMDPQKARIFLDSADINWNDLDCLQNLIDAEDLRGLNKISRPKSMMCLNNRGREKVIEIMKAIR